MPKRLRQQRRGAGKSSTYLAPSHRWLCDARYKIKGEAIGKVVDILHDPARYAPVMVVEIENGKKHREYLIAPAGIKTGDVIHFGGEEIKLGNVLELGKIPEGTQVCNVELRPGDGGKLCRAPGTSATIIAHEGDRTLVMLPSKRIVSLPSKCRATIGVVAGAGINTKPFLKAGAKFYAMRAKHRYWPIVSAGAKNPVDHPFGGKSRRVGRPKTRSRRLPPGAKVGSISARRTGRRKK